MNFLDNIVNTFLITTDNAKFDQKNGILYCTIDEIGFSDRVFVARAFPFQKKDEYISVINEDKEEIGMILSLNEFPEDIKNIINHELGMRYFTPVIKKINTLNEQYGHSYWECETDFGPINFSVKNTFKSLIRISDVKLYVVDSDGCRYLIEDVEKLDPKSHQKIELYL